MSRQEIESFLQELGLPQYVELFESNKIGRAELETLTSDELKEMGVASLGHRKAILAAIQSKAAASKPTPVVQSLGEERVYLETRIETVHGAGKVVEFSDDDEEDLEDLEDEDETAEATKTKSAVIKITSKRAILGEKTYALQNIAAVDAYSFKALVKVPKSASEQADEKKLEQVMFGVTGLVCLGIAAYAASQGWSTAGFGCCGLLGVLFLGMIFFASGSATKSDHRDVWSVRIQASGTSDDVIQSLNKQKIEEIVKALNEAIVNLNM